MGCLGSGGVVLPWFRGVGMFESVVLEARKEGWSVSGLVKSAHLAQECGGLVVVVLSDSVGGCIPILL